MSIVADDRVEAAEEVCWTVLLAMHLDILPAADLHPDVRSFLAEPMQKWADLAARDGDLSRAPDPEDT